MKEWSKTTQKKQRLKNAAKQKIIIVITTRLHCECIPRNGQFAEMRLHAAAIWVAFSQDDTQTTFHAVFSCVSFIAHVTKINEWNLGRLISFCVLLLLLVTLVNECANDTLKTGEIDAKWLHGKIEKEQRKTSYTHTDSNQFGWGAINKFNTGIHQHIRRAREP